MLNLYTQNTIEQQKKLLKKTWGPIGLMLLSLLLLSLPLIIYRDPKNHLPSVLLLSILWMLGIWWILTKILEKVIPLTQDIAFSQMIMNRETKEIHGLIVECSKKITLLRTPCYILKYKKEGEEDTIYQTYLDEKFYMPEIQAGATIRMRTAQHFICAYEIGGKHE